MILVLKFNIANSMTDFYYSSGNKIEIEISTNTIVIKLTTPDNESIEELLSSFNIIKELKPLTSIPATGFYKITLFKEADIENIASTLQKQTNIMFVSPVYLIGGVEAIPYDQFVIQCKPNVTRSEIEAFNKKNHVEIYERKVPVPGLYRLRITEASELSVVDMAKLYYESFPLE